MGEGRGRTCWPPKTDGMPARQSAIMGGEVQHAIRVRPSVRRERREMRDHERRLEADEWKDDGTAGPWRARWMIYEMRGDDPTVDGAP